MSDPTTRAQQARKLRTVRSELSAKWLRCARSQRTRQLVRAQIGQIDEKLRALDAEALAEVRGAR